MRWIMVVLAVACGAANAQNQPFEPYEGQPGKDVVWVPTPPALVEKMLDMAAVTPRDFVIDLGSGDGRMVIAAAKRGARALGVEYDAEMVALARRNAAAAGVGEAASFVQGDMYEADISRATVLALFLLPVNMNRLAPKFLTLPAGTRIVSNAYRIDGWVEETVASLDSCFSWCTARLYLVPARVTGAWRLPHAEVRFAQDVHTVSGALVRKDGTEVQVEGRVRGEELRFTAGGDSYIARVRGGVMTGEARGAFSGAFSAVRID
jgi:SAM-dependent methyltransferase